MNQIPGFRVQQSSSTPNDFNPYADGYNEVLNKALAVSGEDREFFAMSRISCLARVLDRIGNHPRHIMDFGCGTGLSMWLLVRTLGATGAIGIDPSVRSLEVARRSYGSGKIRFLLPEDYQTVGDIDLAYCNGVFHHIPVAKRPAALLFVFKSLKPGGLFSFWENNPWNPGTRYVMARCAFDKDAITVRPGEARLMLRSQGFNILKIEFHFIFPRLLKALRPIEQVMRRFPIGAQYHLLCQKPR